MQQYIQYWLNPAGAPLEALSRIPDENRDQIADFLGDLSQQSDYAAGACAIVVQPEGVLLFGTMSAGSAALNQLFRPNLPGAIQDVYIDAVTSGWPTQVGVPVETATKSVLDLFDNNKNDKK